MKKIIIHPILRSRDGVIYEEARYSANEIPIRSKSSQSINVCPLQDTTVCSLLKRYSKKFAKKNLIIKLYNNLRFKNIAFYTVGPKRQESKAKPKIGGDIKFADFEGETLSMLSTLYKNKANGTFVERNVRTKYF